MDTFQPTALPPGLFTCGTCGNGVGLMAQRRSTSRLNLLWGRIVTYWCPQCGKTSVAPKGSEFVFDTPGVLEQYWAEFYDSQAKSAK